MQFEDARGNAMPPKPNYLRIAPVSFRNDSLRCVTEATSALFRTAEQRFGLYLLRLAKIKTRLPGLANFLSNLF
jgi:hypothetical protein